MRKDNSDRMKRREMKNKKNEEGNEDDNDAITGRLSDETIKYFQRVDQVLEESVFEDEEHKEAFLHNVFKQVETDGTHLARHSNKTSRIIEKIIPYLNGKLYEKLIHIIEPELEMLVCDRFGSHVIETLCKNGLQHCENDIVAEAFVSFCKILRKKCSIFIRDTYGSHVISTVLQVLSGVKAPESVTKSYASRNTKKKKKPTDDVTEPILTEVPRLFKKCFKKYVSVIQSDINFGELICHRTGSPVLHVLLIATSIVSKKHYQELYSTIVARGRIFDFGYDDGGGTIDEVISLRLPIVFVDNVGSHLFEAIIKTADESNLDELAEKCFKSCIVALCIHSVANYLAQTFLRSLKTLKHVELFVEKLMGFTEDILAAGNMGCIIRLAEVINKFEMVEYQKRFISTLSKALHIPENTKRKPLVKLILCMMTYDLFYKISEKEIIDDGTASNVKKEESEEQEEPDEIEIDKDSINYHGACLLKNLFSFKKSRDLVDSYVALTEKELMNIACHPHGCLVFESFFQSQWIPNKKKNALAEMLLVVTQKIACDKFGSRVVDCIWKGVDDTMQERIRSVLREHKIELESDLYGRIILYNCGVKQHVPKMREIEEQQAKKRKLFEEIIQNKKEDNEIPVVKQKKKNDDRAAKYREQLKSLGIVINEENENTEKEDDSIKKVNEKKDDTQTDLADVLQAIEATVQQKNLKKKK